MPKNIDDIKPQFPERRSIRNIPIPEKRRKTDFVDSVAPASKFGPIPRDINPVYTPKRSTDILPPETHSHVPHRRSSDTHEQAEPVVIHKRVVEEAPKVEPQERRTGDRRRGGDRRNTKRNLFIIAALIIAVGVLGIFSLSSGATVTYTPKSTPITFNKDTYSAFKTAAAGQLLFSVIKLSGDKGVAAPASGEETVSLKASGKAVVYNEASADPQKLIKNTRFQSADGKIFRIQNDITIPGKKGTEPGSLEVTLYADQPGAEYNVSLSDFTVPGLKGDPRFTTIYARSKTPMTGGFVGLSKKVNDADLAKAKASLEKSLKDELLVQAKAQVPEDFILYPDLVQVNYADSPQSAPSSNGVTVNRHADFYGIMFKRTELANYLASKKVSDGSILPVRSNDLENLKASYAASTTQDLLKAEEIKVEFNGSMTAVSNIPTGSLKTDLAGSSKSTLVDILKKYPNILTATAVVRPFWKGSFPDDITKINIVEAPLK